MNLIQKNRENGFLTPNRYLEFGNAIREKYAQGEGYGGASLLYAQEPVAAKPQESGTSSQITNNYYTLRFLRQENVLYQQNLSFLMQVLEKRLQQNVYTTLEHQLEKVIRQELKDAKPAQIREIVKETKTLLKEGGSAPLEQALKQMSRERETLRELSSEGQKDKALKEKEQKEKEQLVRKITNLYYSSQLSNKYETVQNNYLTNNYRSIQALHQNVYAKLPEMTELAWHTSGEGARNEAGAKVREASNLQAEAARQQLSERWGEFLWKGPKAIEKKTDETGRKASSAYMPSYLEYKGEESKVQKVPGPAYEIPHLEYQSEIDSKPGEMDAAGAVRKEEAESSSSRQMQDATVDVKAELERQLRITRKEGEVLRQALDAQEEQRAVLIEQAEANKTGRMSFEAYQQAKEEEKLEAAYQQEPSSKEQTTRDPFHGYDSISMEYRSEEKVSALPEQQTTGQQATSRKMSFEQFLQVKAEEKGLEQERIQKENTAGAPEYIPVRMEYRPEEKGPQENWSQEKRTQVNESQENASQVMISREKVMKEPVRTDKSEVFVPVNQISGKNIQTQPGTTPLMGEGREKSVPEKVTLARATYPAHQPIRLQYQEEPASPETEERVRTVIRDVLSAAGSESMQKPGSVGETRTTAVQPAALQTAAQQTVAAKPTTAAQQATAAQISRELVYAVDRLAGGTGEARMQKPGQSAGRTITNARVLGKALQQTADGQGSVPVSAVDRVQAGQGDVLVRSRRQAMGEIERIFLEEETAVQAGAEPVPEARLQERILKVLMPYREAASRYYESQNMPSVPGARSSMLRSRPGKSMTLNKPEALIQPAKEPVVQWEEAPMVYEEDKEQRIRKADNQIKQLTQQTHEVLREIQVVKETTVTHEKIIEEQQKLQENREKISRTQVLPKEQIREVLDQEVYRSMEKQLDGSVNRIVDRVYQRLEDKLRSERSRRGLI